MAIEHRALCALSIALTASIVAYPDLPPDIPPRAGREGAFIGAPFVAFLLPFTAIVIWWLFARLERGSDPAWPTTRAAAAVTVLFLSAFHITTLIALIGAHLWLGRVLGVMVGGFLIATGNELPRVRPNLVWGIRIPVTLQSDGVWRRVHRLGGYIRTIMGIAVCIASAAGMRGFPALIVIAVATETLACLGVAMLLSRQKAAVLVAFLICGSGNAAPANGQPLPLDKIETLPAFVDTMVPKLMAQQHVAGTAVVLVHDGRVVLLRGYGKAHVDSGVGVDPSRTLFRIGSVTKVFTAAAIMQLVEAGKIDLHRDVRHYLPDIRLRYGATTHQLLTHTAGLDERFAGAYTDSPKHLQSLSEHLRRYTPEQVFRPGSASSYSNYNYALAGLVIERVSGLTYDDYLVNRIFKPLRMTSTTVRQPPLAEQAGDLARGYRWADGRHVPIPYNYTQATPAGAMTATAADVGRFMLAILADGSLDGEPLLSPASLRPLLQPQYTPHPRIPGSTYGFGRLVTRGRRLLHRGGTLGDQAGFLLLAPADRLGLFVASNALPGIGDFLFEPMMTHLAGPATAAPPPVPLPDARERAPRFAGTYRTFRQVRNEMARLRSLWPVSQSRVAAEADGAIRWRGRRWMEVEPLLFRSVESDDYILFRQGADGSITGLGGYERIGWWEQTWFHLAVLASCVIAFLVYLLSRGIRLVRRRAVSLQGRTAEVCAMSVAIMNVMFVAGLAVSFSNLGAITPLPLPTLLLLSLPVVSLAPTALLPAFAARSWWEHWWTRRERLAYSLLALSAVAFATFLNYWRLLGVRY